MLFKLLERLRNESDSYRKKVAIVAALCITGIVILGWSMFVSGGFVYSYRKPAATVSSTSPITATREALTQSVGLLKDLFSIFGESKIMFSATSTASQETED